MDRIIVAWDAGRMYRVSGQGRPTQYATAEEVKQWLAAHGWTRTYPGKQLQGAYHRVSA